MCDATSRTKSAGRNGSDQRGNVCHPAKLCVPNKTAQIDFRVSLTPCFSSALTELWSFTCTYHHTQPRQKIELGAKTMFKSSVLHIQDQGTAEERLWRAVITKTLEEWMCGPLSFSRKAEQFLFDDNKDFKAVCSSAGMDPIRLRKRLQTIRARGIQKENIPFRVRTHKRLSFPQPAGWGQRAFGV
jgi:hypothetical protein